MQLLVLAGVALTVLLGVVAFVSRGHSAPTGGGSSSRSASQLLVNSVFTIWFLAMALGAVMLVWVLAQKKFHERQAGRSRRSWVVLGFLLFFLVFAVLLRHWVGIGSRSNRAQNQVAIIHKALKKAEHKRAAGHNTAVAPSFQWNLALALLALFVAVTATVVLRAHARRSKLSKEVSLIKELHRVVDETLDDLRNEADPRKAVIAAYARMEKVLAVHGLPRRPSEAPLEYLERVLEDLQVTQPAVERLTELFTRAKFSHHAVDPQMKDDAIDALVTLREQVRAVGTTVDKPALRLEDIPRAAQ